MCGKRVKVHCIDTAYYYTISSVVYKTVNSQDFSKNQVCEVFFWFR